MSVDLDLLLQPACVLAERIRARELAPLELLDQCIERIHEVNPTLNAFVALREDEARAEAQAVGDALARGEEVGPLAGLPLGVKDLEDAAGLPTTCGSVPLKDHMPAEDSTQVARLKAAGAIVLGKTNTPEFGFTAMTKNLVFGITRNPWNPERTPGGSSGGSSAAIAAGMVPLVTASDGGGSVRIPACFVGAFGLKPTYGRIPRGPHRVQSFSDTSCQGPLTRSVRDAALFLDCTVGAHWSDPDSLPYPGYSYVARLEGLPPNLRIAWSPTLGYARVEPDVLAQQCEAVAVFRELGHTVEEIDDVLPRSSADRNLIADLDVYLAHADLFREHADQLTRSMVQSVRKAAALTADDLAELYTRRVTLNEAIHRIFERYDLLLTPQLPVEAFGARGPFPSEIAGSPLDEPSDAIAFTFPFNLTGLPAASVRAGFSKNGLPVGLQIAAPRHRDDLVLQAAYAYEQARPWQDDWPRDIPRLRE